MNSLRNKFLLFVCLSYLLGSKANLFAQRSKHGVKLVTTANNIVNEYTSLNANAASGATTITVAASALNANARFPGNLAPGDLIMIIQMQGASIDGTPSDGSWPNPPLGIGIPTDSSWGSVTAYNNCGNWEFAGVKSVPNGTSIELDCPLTYSYTATGKTQIIRVQRYSSLTINAGASITCPAWNSTVGGVCAIEVETNSIINGSINTTGTGFRGGQLDPNWHNPLMNLFFSASTLDVDGAEKGEGIAGYQTDYTQYGGRYMRGAPGNGGGGGNIHNGGGGGGANGGNPAGWNGHGMPDVSVASHITAWNLQYAGFATQTSSGGGQGGYGWSANNGNPTVWGPGNTSWGGQSRHAIGGYGGRPLNYTSGKLFLGGGGGAGEQDNAEGGAGANGGGLIYLMNYGTVSGTGQLISNGNNGFNTTGVLTISNHRDGAGGGGGGGTVIVNSVGAITGISITANGGNGGNQTISQTQAEGPGGGGSGGYISISNGTPTRTVNGGLNGTTTSSGVNPEFPPNGATAGGVGTNTATITNFVINAPNVTICAGQAATLTATLGGTPGGAIISWYDASVAGNVIGTGGTLTTSVIATAGTYTFYVATCPGTYHQPVLVTATNSPAVSASPNTTICTGGNTTLTSSAGSSYSWSPATGLSYANISNPVASPASTTTYVVTVGTPCGPGTATVVVTVISSINPTITGNNTICAGGNSSLVASGGNTYSWSTGATTSSIIVSPTTTSTYTINVGSGSCTGTTSITVNVTPGITAAVSPNTTICSGDAATLTASNGSSYSWSSGQSTSSIVVTPSSTTTYSVVAYSGSCSDTQSVTVTISNNITATINGPTNICTGGSATLTASGGTTYLWSNSATTSSIVVTPATNTSYTVIAFSGSCSDDDTLTINVGANITASVSGNTTLCGGTSSTLTASGGTNYVWNTGASSATIVITPAPSSITTYTVTAFSGSCFDTATVTVNALPTLSTTVSGNTIICIGETSTLTALVSPSGGNTYLWSTGATAASISVSPATSTTYSVIGYAGSCSDTLPVTVTVVSQASVTVSQNTTICAGQSTQLSATGSSVYSWSNGATTSAITVSPPVNTTFTIVAGAGACSDTDSVSVTVNPSPIIIVSNNVTICAGETASLNASGGNGYVWSNGATTSATTVTPSTTTSYSVVTSSGSCNDTGTVTVLVSPPPTAIVSGTNICQGQAATLSASPAGATYVWNTGATTASINPTVPGTYSVLVAIGQCTATASFTTFLAANPIATVSSGATIVQGQSVNLTAGGGGTYQWSNGGNGATITVSPNNTTQYCVTVTNASNCIDTACVTVVVDQCSNAGTLYLPNAFSPNGDGENDELQVYYLLPACIENFHLALFNRWGEQVFETSDIGFKWDGAYNGMIFGKQMGGTEVYSYFLTADLVDGTRISMKGNISLLR